MCSLFCGRGRSGLLSAHTRISGIRRLSHSRVAQAIVPLAVVHLADIEVSLRIRLGRQAVEMKELPRVVAAVAADRIEQCERLAVEDVKRLVRSVRHVEV